MYLQDLPFIKCKLSILNLKDAYYVSWTIFFVLSFIVLPLYKLSYERDMFITIIFTGKLSNELFTGE